MQLLQCAVKGAYQVLKAKWAGQLWRRKENRYGKLIYVKVHETLNHFIIIRWLVTIFSKTAQCSLDRLVTNI